MTVVNCQQIEKFGESGPESPADAQKSAVTSEEMNVQAERMKDFVERLASLVGRQRKRK